MDPEFYELFSSTVTIERYTGEDPWGNNTYAAGVSVRCYLDQDRESFTSTETDAGANIGTDNIDAVAYVDIASPVYQEGDLVLLPGNRPMRVVAQQVYYDEHGPYHQVLTMANNQER